MKQSTIIALILLVTACGSAKGQMVSIKHVAPNGGGVKTGNILSTATVIGEPVVDYFSSGPLSGSVGYLDGDDLISTGVVAIQPLLYQLKVFPNPNRGEFDVVVKTQQTTAIQLMLTDAIGRIIQIRKAQLVVGENNFHYSNVPTGICLIKLISDKETQVEKIIVAGN